MQVRYLPFLEYEEACVLLKDLGARGGLHWNEDACRLAYEQVNGHPALLRVLGSAVYSDGRTHERRRLLAESNVVDATTSTYRESASILNEICGALREGYPDDYMLLESLARNKIGESYSLAKLSRRRYNICKDLVLSTKQILLLFHFRCFRLISNRNAKTELSRLPQMNRRI